MPTLIGITRACARPMAAVVITVLVLTSSAPAFAATSREEAMFSLIVEARAAQGLPGITLAGDLSRMAHRHSLRMAREHRLFHHSCLTCRFPAGSWQALAENVGTAGSLRGVHRMMMESVAHRVNILGGYVRGGVAVVKKGGQYWVTEIFLA